MKNNNLTQLSQDPPIFKSSRTVSSQIYGILRDQIRNIVLVPGTTLSEQEVANSFNVSRTPVRESLIRLSREKLIIISPQRRTTVAKINIDRMRQERFLRESIECATLETFIHMATDDDIDELSKNVKAQEQALANGDCALFLALDDAFHAHAYHVTNNELCLQIIGRNCFDYQRIRVLSTIDGHSVQQTNFEQHKQILLHIQRKEVKQALSVLHVHLRRVFDEVKELSQKYAAYFE